MLKVTSSLTPELEDLISRVIGCCIEVHRVLGPGLLELTYVRAICIELGRASIGYEREKQITMYYKGEAVGHHRLDLIVADQIVVEVKCVERLLEVHHGQLLGYLRASGLRAGLLMNFNAPLLRDGLRRVVL